MNAKAPHLTLTMHVMTLRAMGRQFRHQLAQNLVALFCAAVVVALFAYVFGDFVNEQVAAVSPAAHRAMALGLCAALSVCGGFVAAKRPQIIRDFARLIDTLGQVPSAVSAYRRRALAIWVLCILSGVLWASSGFDLSPLHLAFLAAIFLAVFAARTLLATRAPRAHGPGSLAARFHYADRIRAARVRTLTKVRVASLQNLLLARRSSFLALWLLSVVFFAMNPHAALPSAVYGLWGLLTGIFFAALILRELASALEHAWLERSSGVSHDEYMAALLHGCVHVALWAVVFVVSAALPGCFITGANPWHACISAATPPLLCAALLFQMEPRQPHVSLLATILVSLFVVTAIYVHPLAVVLIPITVAAGMNYQKKRFYRA